jgi:hypothetical protein
MSDAGTFRNRAFMAALPALTEIAEIQWALQCDDLPAEERERLLRRLDEMANESAAERRKAERELHGVRQQIHELERKYPGLGQQSRLTPLIRRQPRGREHRPRAGRARATCRAAARSPGRLADDPPPGESDPALTPLQRATLLLLEALVAASEGGLPTYLAFLDLAATRIAAEVARTTDWNEPL